MTCYHYHPTFDHQTLGIDFPALAPSALFKSVLPSANNVDGTVRDLLAARDVVLSPSELQRIHGFNCIGIAEKIPDLSLTLSSQVHVWHITDDLYPVTPSEVERWMVDTPPGKHWILSEREFDSSLIEQSNSLEVVVWGPERMASWIGESVLSGELGTFLQTEEEIESPVINIENASSENQTVRTLRPLVELNNWLEQRGWDGARTSPVLLSARLWDITGTLTGPDDQPESGNWQIIEDPWASTYQIHESEQVLGKSPALRIMKPSSGWMAERDSLPSEMLKLADQRRQGEPETNDDEVSSIMLEWWRLDQSSVQAEFSQLAIPGWIIYLEGNESKLLHGRNGRLYEFD